MSLENENICAQGLAFSRRVCASRAATTRSPPRPAGAEPSCPSARRTPSISAQLTWLALATACRCRANTGFSRSAGGVGSVIGLFSQTTPDAAPSSSGAGGDADGLRADACLPALARANVGCVAPVGGAVLAAFTTAPERVAACWTAACATSVAGAVAAGGAVVAGGGGYAGGAAGSVVEDA